MPTMSEDAALSEVRVSYFTTAGAGEFELCVKSDPQRLYLSIEQCVAAAGVLFVIPLGGNDPAINPGQGNLPKESKYVDCPGRTTTEWYVWSFGVNTIAITEEIRTKG